MGIRRSIVGLALAVVVLAGAAPALTSSNGVVISEFRFRGPVGGNDEYVELMNAGSGPVDICALDAAGLLVDDRRRIRTHDGPGRRHAAGRRALPLHNNNAPAATRAACPAIATYATGFTDGAGARIVDAGGAVDRRRRRDRGGPECREGTGICGMPTANGDQSYERKSGAHRTRTTTRPTSPGPKAGNPQNHAGADAAPSVTSRSPGDDATDVADGPNVSVTFSEPVTVTGPWYTISCASSGTHTATVERRPDDLHARS